MARSSLSILVGFVLSTGCAAADGTPEESLEDKAIQSEASVGPAFANWPSYGHDHANSRTNPSEQSIKRDNVSRLREKWRYGLGVSAVTSTPAIYDGIAYFNSWNGTAYAVKAATGVPVWQTLLQLPQGDALSAQISSSPAVTQDAVYVTGEAAEVFKIDRASGAILWKSKVDDSRATRLWSSPVVVGDLLIFGVGSYQVFTAGETCLGPLGSGGFTFRGNVVGVDTATGAVRWRVYVTPPDNYGVSVWSSAAVDTARKLAFIGTGQGYTLPASPLSDSLIAIRYDTGELAWSHQFTADDVWSLGGEQVEDWDVGASPNLFNVGDREAVGVGDKAGNYYALDRDTGDVIWSRALTPGSHLGGVLASSAYNDGVIYLASNDGIEFAPDEPHCITDITLSRPAAADVIALEASTGNQIWRTRVTPGVFGGVTIANQIAYLTTVDGHVRAFGTTDGQQLWTAYLGDKSASGVTVSGGMVFVGTGWDWLLSPPGQLVAFGLPCDKTQCPACPYGKSPCCNALGFCGCAGLFGLCL